MLRNILLLFTCSLLPFTVYSQDSGKISMSHPELVQPLSDSGSSAKIDSMKNLLVSLKGDTERVNLLNDLGLELIDNSEYDNAMDYLLKAKILAEKSKYPFGIGRSLQRIGMVEYSRGNFTEATEHFLQALNIMQKLGNQSEIGKVLNNLGNACVEKGNYLDGLNYFVKARKIFEAIRDKETLARVIINIGRMYTYQGSYQKALSYEFEALKLWEVLGKKNGVANCLNGIGLIYQEMNNDSIAIEYFLNALKTANESNEKQIPLLSTIYGNLGIAYHKTNRDSLAIQYYLTQIEIGKDLGDKHALARAYLNISNSYLKLKQDKRAIEYFEKGLELVKQTGDKRGLSYYYYNMANFFEDKKDFKKAYEYRTLYSDLSDSLFSETNTKQVAEMEAKYQNEKKEKEIELLKKKEELQNAKYDKQKQFIFASVIIAVVLSLSLFLFYNRQQLKKKNLLERKNFELERNALSVQMNPHFIFNSLGSISGFIAENEKEKAIEYLGVFARLIRHNLEQSREQLVSVAQEVQMLKSYLHLQQLRFDNKFDYKVSADESVDSSTGLPPMFIQPYVENAILHGVIPKEGTGNISVKFFIGEDKELICEVEDDGIGKTESMKRKSEFDNHHKSLAMTITDERMAIINAKSKEKIQISMKELAENGNSVTGTKVTFRFPIQYV